MMMVENIAGDFYSVQKIQWQKSLTVFFVILVFYVFALGLLAAATMLSFGLFIPSLFHPTTNFFLMCFATIIIMALLIALFQFLDAKANGARFIERRLQAKPPDQSDRYHQRFVNVLQEMCLACGVPKAKPYILPTFAVNSMALLESNGRPAVFVTEGLLAEFTRDELGAVIAHELAHITRGDTVYITLVCSLGNFFERIKESFEPEEFQPNWNPDQGKGKGSPLLFTMALSISVFVMHLLSTLISRQREILADAAAVEICRNPEALARAIYRAQVKNSFVGDFTLTYSPLFIVPPYSKGISENVFSRIFNTHPPLLKRIKYLAGMVPTSPKKIIEEVLDIQQNRAKARAVIDSYETQTRDETELNAAESSSGGRIWYIHRGKGDYPGPLSLEELVFHKHFTPRIRIQNIQEGIEATAVDFPQIRTALKKIGKRRHLTPRRQNKCPRCGISLRYKYYEGVPTKQCTDCGGRLIRSDLVERIITRQEVTFSDDLIDKAVEFKEHFMDNPLHYVRLNSEKARPTICPDCGSKMVPRPYTYQYIIPVDKCLSCQNIWFDTDELEILQLLIENPPMDHSE
ncbi:M48 family metalloprotease [Acidobacteriota bacterium]